MRSTSKAGLLLVAALGAALAGCGQIATGIWLAVQKDHDGRDALSLPTAAAAPFSSGEPLASGVGTPVAIRAADLDGDGIRDLVLLSAAGSVQPLLGSGGGAFSAGVSLSAVGVRDVALRDVDRDGAIDLVLGSARGLEVAPGAGDGTFGLARHVVDGDVRALGLADFDDDGEIDVLWGGPADAVVLLGSGGLASVTTHTVLATAATRAIAVDDFDGDGDVDALIAYEDQPAELRLNAGDGTLGAAPHLVLGDRPATRVALAHLDGRDEVDILLAHGEHVELWWSYGSGNYRTTTSLGASFGELTSPGDSAIVGLGAADLVGGPSLDPVVVYADGTVAVHPDLVDDPIRSFPEDTAFGLRRTLPGPVALAALIQCDARRAADLIVAGPAGLELRRAPEASAALPFYAGPPTLLDPGATSHEQPLVQLLADVDGDGDLDAITVEGRLLENLGGTFGPASSIQAVPNDRLMAADLDGDGAAEVLSLGSSALTTSRFAEAGAPFETVQVVPLAEVAVCAAVGDCDGDGDLDVVVGTIDVATLEGEAVVQVNDGAGLLVEQAKLAAKNTAAIALIDAEGDGDVDIVTGGDWGAPNELWLNRGAGRWHNARLDFGYPTGFFSDGRGSGAATLLATSDLDEDGREDLIVSGSMGTAFLRGTARGLSPWRCLGVQFDFARDVDGDGDLDFGYREFGSRPLLWLNLGRGELTPVPFGPEHVDTSSEVPHLVDLDGDGRLDWLQRDGLFRGRTSDTPGFTRDRDLDYTGLGGSDPRAVVVVDLDGGGTLGAISGASSGRVRLVRSSGRGFTELGGGQASSSAIAHVAAADLDLDRLIDAVATDVMGDVHVLRRAGRELIPVVTLTTGWTAGTLLGRLDGDEGPDLVAFGQSDTEVYLNDGTLALGAPSVTFPWEASAGALGDLAAGGPPEAVFVDDSTLRVVSDLAGTPTVTEYAAPQTLRDLALGDTDADGDLDVVVVGEEYLAVWENDGSGGLTRASSVELYSTRLALTDLEADGDLDVVSGDDVGAWAALNDGLGGLEAPYRVTREDVYDWRGLVGVAPLTGDGRPDLIVLQDSDLRIHRRWN